MKILLMPNFPGWAFDNIARGIRKYGSHKYEIKYECDYRKYRGKDLPKEELNWNEYDRIVLFAPWMHWTNVPMDKTICIFHEEFEIKGYNTKQYYKSFVTSDISWGLVSGKLNLVKVQTGIDTDYFFPISDRKRGRTKIGWVGAYSGHVEKKGYEKYYLPLGKWFDLVPHTKEDHYIDETIYQQHMREYYDSIDVLVCTSSFEGYPLGILEGSMCGVPVVSTRVGVAPEILPSSQVVDRDVLAFKKTIEEETLKVADVTGFDWKLKIKEWDNAFI